jgi:L-aspartate oxidase
VYVDIRHHGKDFLSKRFPGISEECLKRGIDISKDLIPVTPAAHYLCGGIKTNEYGETSISGLLAFGECSQTGVHGANRMASNSLLECLAFTAISARNQTINNQENKVYTQKYETKIVESASQIKSELQTTMWDNVGIIRNYVGLENALNSVERLRKRLELITGINKEIIETRNMIDVASLIVKAALTRKESRGTHNMDEYHFKDDEKWLKHIVFKGDKLEIKKFD